MDNFNEDSIKYLGYPFSFDFINRLHRYFNEYYRNLFCKIGPIWLKYVSNEDEINIYDRCEVEDINYVKHKNLYNKDIIDKNYVFDIFKDFILSKLNYTSANKVNYNTQGRLKLNLEENLSILICPSLLGVYRSDIYRSFLIFPFYASINSNLVIPKDLIELFKNISKSSKFSDSTVDVNIAKRNEIKVGYLDNLQRVINRHLDINILISVHFDTNTDFTLFEFNFNNALNYIN